MESLEGDSLPHVLAGQNPSTIDLCHSPLADELLQPEVAEQSLVCHHTIDERLGLVGNLDKLEPDAERGEACLLANDFGRRMQDEIAGVEGYLDLESCSNRRGIIREDKCAALADVDHLTVQTVVEIRHANRERHDCGCPWGTPPLGHLEGIIKFGHSLLFIVAATVWP